MTKTVLAFAVVLTTSSGLSAAPVYNTPADSFRGDPQYRVRTHGDWSLRVIFYARLDDYSYCWRVPLRVHAEQLLRNPIWCGAKPRYIRSLRELHRPG